MIDFNPRMLLRFRRKCGSEKLTRCERNIIVFTDTLQNQERERLCATVGHQMRSRCPNYMDFAGLQFASSFGSRKNSLM